MNNVDIKYKSGCYVKDKNMVYQIKAVRAEPDGKVLLNLDGFLPSQWASASNYEFLEVHPSYVDDSWQPPVPDEVTISRAEYNELLKADMWWTAALLSKVNDWCNFDSIIDNYKMLEKENNT